MAINKNHEFEELNGIKCAIVERNVSTERLAFLKNLLEFNKYKVVFVSSPPPKPVAATPPAKPVATEPGAEPAPSAESKAPPPSVPETYTVGVTDLTFNPINAIFGRLLKTKDGHIVTLAFWKQKESVSQDEIPYYERNL